MNKLINHFKDPLKLILTIMVILSMLGAWLYGKQPAGIDYYVAWVAADAVKNDTPHNIYDPASRYKLAVEYRNKADLLKDAPRQKLNARHRQSLPMTATPFLYWVTGILATGDYENDLLHSRDKRIFDDPTGIRCARNTNPFLLQTYARDTGEVLSDLSLPIYIDDRHWGNVRLGFNPQVLLDEDKE